MAGEKGRAAVKMRAAFSALAALALTAACVPPRAVPPPGSWDYVVDAPTADSRVVRVLATFVGAGTEKLAIDESAAAYVKDLAIQDGAGWRPISKIGAAWTVPQCVRACTLRYQVDLGAVAESCDQHIDCARRVGGATLSPAMAWLIHPSPKMDVPARLRVRAPNPAEFASGLREADEPLREGLPTYAFRSIELDEGSFTAFGPMRRTRVDVSAGTLDVIMLGPPLTMTDAETRGWIVDAAGLVAGLYGRFPVSRSTVFVVPVNDSDEVLFGKVLSLAGASVTVMVGNAMPKSATHDDWVLVHELIHLGFPSFRGEGRWLGEGIATYYEPILRARAGWMSEKQLWAFFAHEMRRALPPAAFTVPLQERDDLDAIYWGGALYALEADIALRRSAGARSLDDVLRATLARGGDAMHVWTVAEVLRFGDETTKSQALTDLYRRQVAGHEAVDLDALFASLGVDVRSDGEVVLRDDRPLSAVRRAISRKVAR